MNCYVCGSEQLELAPLTPKQRADYVRFDIVLRRCTNCGLPQNHVGVGEPLTPEEAAREAASV